MKKFYPVLILLITFIIHGCFGQTDSSRECSKCNHYQPISSSDANYTITNKQNGDTAQIHLSAYSLMFRSCINPYVDIYETWHFQEEEKFEDITFDICQMNELSDMRMLLLSAKGYLTSIDPDNRSDIHLDISTCKDVNMSILDDTEPSTLRHCSYRSINNVYRYETYQMSVDDYSARAFAGIVKYSSYINNEESINIELQSWKSH